jgi:hypothetical protein
LGVDCSIFILSLRQILKNFLNRPPQKSLALRLRADHFANETTAKRGINAEGYDRSKQSGALHVRHSAHTTQAMTEA